jgi:hypothetical protein
VASQLKGSRHLSAAAGREPLHRRDQPEVRDGVGDLGPPARLEVGQQREPRAAARAAQPPERHNPRPVRDRADLWDRGLLRSPATPDPRETWWHAVSPGHCAHRQAFCCCRCCSSPPLRQRLPACGAARRECSLHAKAPARPLARPTADGVPGRMERGATAPLPLSARAAVVRDFDRRRRLAVLNERMPGERAA